MNNKQTHARPNRGMWSLSIHPVFHIESDFKSITRTKVVLAKQKNNAENQLKTDILNHND